MNHRWARAPMQPPVKNYALIGDCYGDALISRGGSVDWCTHCNLSRSDFFRLLDADAASSTRWPLAPKVHRTPQVVISRRPNGCCGGHKHENARDEELRQVSWSAKSRWPSRRSCRRLRV